MPTQAHLPSPNSNLQHAPKPLQPAAPKSLLAGSIAAVATLILAAAIAPPLALADFASDAGGALPDTYYSEAGGTTDIIISVLVIIATLALVTLTLGVSYLSFVQWQNDTDERKNLSSFDSSTNWDQLENQFKSGSGKDKKKRPPPKKASVKGFGK